MLLPRIPVIIPALLAMTASALAQSVTPAPDSETDIEKLYRSVYGSVSDGDASENKAEASLPSQGAEAAQEACDAQNNAGGVASETTGSACDGAGSSAETERELVPATYPLVYPGKRWEKARPENLGYDSRKLAAVDRYIRSKLSITHMMVIVGGKVMYSMGNEAEPLRIASCRKSLLSMMYGKYVEDGTIDLDATLKDLHISDIGGLRPIEKSAKVRHLITARSGVYHPASNPGDDSALAPKRGSVVPGTFFLYNNWDFNCAGTVFEKLTKQNIYEAFENDIASKIGLQDYKWEEQHKSGDLSRSEHPAYHFAISTRDMARIGYLMLRRGIWENGEQVVSPTWIDLTTSPLNENPPPAYGNPRRKPQGYSYMWWIWGAREPAEVFAGCYSACGTGGQYITVVPMLDMVIACKDKTKKMTTDKYRDLIERIAACRM